ncbi:MAG TPA: hypothetical protein VF688_01975 [Allosphingosinicella sp.]|jgi:hypothetical protein
MVARSIHFIGRFAALACALATAPAAARESATQVAHTPWLGIRLVQDGKPVPLVRTDLRTTEARLMPRPFRILFPKRRTDIAYQLCAWTGKSIFRALRPRTVAGDPNAGGEHPCFDPGTGMADTEAGSGILMLSDSGHNYLIDLRLGPNPERPSVYYSALWTRAGGEVPIVKARRPVYVVVFHDSDGDGYVANDEYDHLVLRFGR